MKYDVNLFPPRRAHALERVGYFVAHYLRYAVVITLGLIIVIFFLRMNVDRQIADEKERLAMRRSIIEATKPLRVELEIIQRKINHINTVFAAQDIITREIEYITSVIPESINVQDVTLRPDQTTIEADTEDYRIIPIFVAKLLRDKRFTKVQVTKVEKQTSGSYVFAVALGSFVTQDTSPVK